MIKTPNEYVCIKDLAWTGNPIRV
ncbi:hypothetical protein F383_02256 [Gossypium arboreum]|uniref:Uncharacterized protein n=1 Tax=Gossypium arboreum TaxID=29729 RepID=A0A0B0NC46_GOSAR|nr:hypothetical protein F383_02256 [Gossypium arboreum]